MQQVRISCRKYNGQSRALRLHLARHFRPVHSGHGKIDEGEIDVRSSIQRPVYRRYARVHLGAHGACRSRKIDFYRGTLTTRVSIRMPPPDCLAAAKEN